MEASYLLLCSEQPTHHSLYELERSKPHLTPCFFKICFDMSLSFTSKLRNGPFVNDFLITVIK